MTRRGRKGRSVSGFLLLDKPAEITSNAALQSVKRMFNAVKAGHTGSLDPLATGLLPLCFGEATKFSQFLLDADKRYLARVKLGVITDSGDADGEVIETRRVPEISDAQLEKALSHHRGEIIQVPSMFSAIKIDGQPLYKLARKGIEVERKGRPINVYELQVTDRQVDEFTLEVQCSKGTYIRTLVEDVGEELGCGAHVIGLRRLSAGPFDETEAVSMSQLEELKGNWTELDKFLLPISAAVKEWPVVELTDITASYLRQGQPVQVSNAPANGWVGIFTESVEEGDSFVGVGEILGDGRVAPRRLVTH